MKQLALALVLTIIASESFAASGGASVIKVTGQAFRGKQPLKAGETVEAGDEISVAENSELDLKLSEGHRARLKSGATMKLGALQAKQRTIDLLKGKLFLHFMKGADAKGLDVRTKTVVAGVRGTQFLAEVDEKKGTYLCVCEGAIEARSGGVARTVKKGQDLWAYPEKPLGEAVDSANMSMMTAQEFASMGF